MNNKREYKYEIVLQKDNEMYDVQLQNIITNFDCLYCTHDKDVYEEDVFNDKMELIHKAGDMKYAHTHFIIKLKYAKTISAVAKIVECKESDIEYIKRLKASMKYLIHYKNDNKFNYDVHEVKHNNEKLYKEFRELIYEDLEEDDRVLPLIEYITSNKNIIYFEQFIYYVQSTRQWGVFKRNASIFIRLLDEHNNHLKKFGT